MNATISKETPIGGCLERLVRRFRVTCSKPLPNPDIRNPFRVSIHSFPLCKTLCRTWEFDAQNEAEVRRLFKEAKRDGEPQVKGMSISRIEDITPNE